MLLLHPLYCTFIIYTAIRLSSHKCATNSVFNVQCSEMSRLWLIVEQKEPNMPDFQGHK